MSRSPANRPCGGDGPPPPTGHKYNAYVANGLDDAVSAFALDRETGALTPGPLINLKTDMQPNRSPSPRSSVTWS